VRIPATSPGSNTKLTVGGGERTDRFGGSERARPPGVAGDENVASPVKLIKFSPQ